MGVKIYIIVDEEENRIKLFHMKVQANKTLFDALFNIGSQVNLIFVDLVNKLRWKTHLNSQPYPLGWLSGIPKCKLLRNVS